MAFKVPFISRKGVVASEHYLSSKLGVDVLDSGGNAVDAAVATSFALSVVSPHMGGLGGDFFALYYKEDKDEVHCLNASGFAPRRLTIDYVMSRGYKDEMPSRGPLSITVPGYVHGVFELHKRFGKKEFSRVISPSINLCYDGFPASQRFCWAINKDHELLESDEGSRTVFLERKPKSEGSIVKFPSIAKTLSIIKEHGPLGFYEGEVCRGIVDYVNSKGGVLDEDDMRGYRPEWVTPLNISYNDYLVYEIPPNSMGAITLLLLNLLKEAGFDKAKKHPPNPEVFAELSNKAYRIKDEYLSDPRFVSSDMKKLLSQGFAQELLKSKQENQMHVEKGSDTTYFAVADKEGNVVSGIQSLFTNFGSGLTVPEFGITLNCRARGFKLKGANRLEPRKRPLHTLSATILIKDDEVLALGASGAEYRPQIYAQLITNYVDSKFDLAKAIESPRYVWEGGKRIVAEEGVDIGLINDYEVRKIPYPGRLGVAQGILVKNGVKWASCDIRGDGIPIGQAT